MKKRYNCNKLGHIQKNCQESLKKKQAVKAYAINAILAFSNTPSVKEKGKGNVTQGMLSIYDVLV